MITRCPSCGASASLDALVSHDDARQAIKVIAEASAPLGRALLQYLGLFRPATRDLSFRRAAVLLQPLVPCIQTEMIVKDGKQCRAPKAAWLWAIDQALAARDAGKLKTPLKSHGWLFAVIASYDSSERIGNGQITQSPNPAPTTAHHPVVLAAQPPQSTAWTPEQEANNKKRVRQIMSGIAPAPKRPPKIPKPISRGETND